MPYAHLRHIKNSVGSFYTSDSLAPYIETICTLISKNPFTLNPFKGTNKDVQKIFMSEGFELYPTVEKTTLVYNRNADSFFKILHPSSLKNRLVFQFTDRARCIYLTADKLTGQGVRLPRVEAYGMTRKSRKALIAMKRVDGRSLYDILIREKLPLKNDLFYKVMDEMAKLHRLGYWLGDAHLSHIFVSENDISGFIDLESIRRNIPYKMKNLAKDLAGLDHPELPLSESERNAFWDYYIDSMKIRNRGKFLKMFRQYSDKRWKA